MSKARIEINPEFQEVIDGSCEQWVRDLQTFLITATPKASKNPSKSSELLSYTWISNEGLPLECLLDCTPAEHGANDAYGLPIEPSFDESYVLMHALLLDTDIYDALPGHVIEEIEQSAQQHSSKERNQRHEYQR